MSKGIAGSQRSWTIAQGRRGSLDLEAVPEARQAGLRFAPLIARGARKLAYGETKRLRVKLTRAGKRRLRGSPSRLLVVAVPGSEPVKSKIKLR